MKISLEPYMFPIPLGANAPFGSSFMLKTGPSVSGRSTSGTAAVVISGASVKVICGGNVDVAVTEEVAKTAGKVAVGGGAKISSMISVTFDGVSAPLVGSISVKETSTVVSEAGVSSVVSEAGVSSVVLDDGVSSVGSGIV